MPEVETAPHLQHGTFLLQPQQLLRELCCDVFVIFELLTRIENISWQGFLASHFALELLIHFAQCDICLTLTHKLQHVNPADQQLQDQPVSASVSATHHLYVRGPFTTSVSIRGREKIQTCLTACNLDCK